MTREMTETERTEIANAVEAAGVSSPEMVFDWLIDTASKGGDWRAELDKAVERDHAHGDLYDYQTGEYIRPATREERELSDAEVAAGREQGVIDVDGRSCYVQD